MRRLVVLHTNDIHGRVDALARSASVIDRVRAEEDAPVFYLDAGDVEETHSRLSNFTKGAGMHRLLTVMGVDGVAVGNGAVLRYGPSVLLEHEAAVGRPQLAANLISNGAVVGGASATTLVERDGVRLGVIGLSPTNWRDVYSRSFRIEMPEEESLVRSHSAALRASGADAVVLLSHLGLDADRALATALGAGVVDVIVGAHSHSLLPHGDWVNGVPIAHAGEYGGHVGRVELDLATGDVRMDLLPVSADVAAHGSVLAEIQTIETEIEGHLAEVVGEAAETLEFATDRECAAVRFLADVIRVRTKAEVALVTAGIAFVSSLPKGPLTRGVLYEACPSSAVPATADVTGAQLLAMLARGLDPEHAAEMPRTFRGLARGFLHVSGAEVRDGRLLVGGAPVEPGRYYRTAGTDWELEPYGDYVDADWHLDTDATDITILREVIEEYFAAHPVPVRATPARWDGKPVSAAPRAI